MTQYFLPTVLDLVKKKKINTNIYAKQKTGQLVLVSEMVNMNCHSQLFRDCHNPKTEGQRV